MEKLDVSAIVNGDSAQAERLIGILARAQAVAPAAVRSRLAHALFEPMFLPPPLHAELVACIAPLREAMQAWQAGADTFLVDPSCWPRRMSQELHAHARYWHPGTDKASRDYQQQWHAMGELAIKVLTGALAPALVEEKLQAISAGHEKLSQRAALLSARLCETERSQLRIVTAESRVLECLNQHLAHRPFPTALHPELCHTLKSELQHLVLNNTDFAQLPFWQLWQRLLPVLGRCFSGEGLEVGDQQLYTSIPPLLDELEQSLSIGTVNPQAYEHWVELLSEHLLLAIKKEPVACAIFQPLADPAGNLDAGTRVTPALLEQLEAFKQGDWFLFTNDEQHALRCQLALSDAALDQLIFVDRAGRKVMTKTKKEFAACISTDIAVPLAPSDPADQLRRIVAPLVDQANTLLAKSQQLKNAKAIAQHQQQARAKAAAQEAAKAQLQARQDAAHKALAEARVLNEAKAKKAEMYARQQAEAAQMSVAENRRRAISDVDELQVGAWLQFESETGAPVERGKLSVILSGVGKYIFVDELGRKKAEYQRDQLVSLLESGSVKVVRKGNNFEDQLAKVIRGLRRDSA